MNTGCACNDTQVQKYALLSLIPLGSRGFWFLPGAHCPGLCMSAKKNSVRIACGSHLDRDSTKIKIWRIHIFAYRCPKDNANVIYGQTGIGMTKKWKILSVDSDRQSPKHY